MTLWLLAVGLIAMLGQVVLLRMHEGSASTGRRPHQSAGRPASSDPTIVPISTIETVKPSQNLLSENELEGKVLTGEEMDKISDEQLNGIVQNIVVYARLSPEHKIRIVKAGSRNNRWWQ
jgi:magnesium-transporting ATPase (P-type)